MIGMYSKEQPFVLCVDKNEIDTLALALSDAIEQHEIEGVYMLHTFNTMRTLLSEIRELQD